MIHDDDGIKLQVDVVGLDLTALIDTRQVVVKFVLFCSREFKIELPSGNLDWRARTDENCLIEIGLTAIATVGVLAVLVFILFVAFKYFDGWYILGAIAVEVALLVFIFHLYRWLRYPGLFQSKSSGRLFFEVLFSILLIYSIPLFAILANSTLPNSFHSIKLVSNWG